MELIEVEPGVEVAVVDAGPAHPLPLVVLGPEPFGVDAWGPALDRMRRQRRTLSIDVRARGRSPATPTGHALSRYADDVAVVLRARGVSRYLGVGWSLGVSVLWEHARRHAGLVALLAVDQPPSRSLGPGELATRVQRIRRDRVAHHREVIAGYWGPREAADPGLAAELLDRALAVPVDAHVAIVTESYRADYWPLLGSLAIPTTVCWADFGTLDQETATRIADLAGGGRAVRFPGVGHLLPRQRPDEFGDVLDRFLEDTNPGASSGSHGSA